MKPAYISLTGTTPQTVPLETNVDIFAVSVRLASGVTMQVALESPEDQTAPNSYTPARTTQAPVWLTAPAAVNGYVSLTIPVSAILLTPTTGGICTVLQQGLT